MKNILFDLDGTLMNTGEGIISSVKKTIADMNLPMVSDSILEGFIGPPLKDAFVEIFKMEQDRALKAVTIFREHYSSEDKLVCSPYEGIEKLLCGLSERGYRLFVATSKPTIFAEEILEHFGLCRYFEEIAGSNLDNTRSKKSEVISYLMEKYSLAADETYMIGDKAQDLKGAYSCGIKGIGVTYGFGTSEELGSEPNYAVVHTPEEIFGLLADQTDVIT